MTYICVVHMCCVNVLMPVCLFIAGALFYYYSVYYCVICTCADCLNE